MPGSPRRDRRHVVRVTRAKADPTVASGTGQTDGGHHLPRFEHGLPRPDEEFVDGDQSFGHRAPTSATSAE